MYAHPSFLKGHQELLSLLKKCKHGTASEKKSKHSSKAKHANKASPCCAGKAVEPPLTDSVQNIHKQNNDQFQTPTDQVRIENEMNNSRVVSPCHYSYYEAIPNNPTKLTAPRSSTYGNIFYNVCNPSPVQVARNVSMSSSDGSSSIDVHSYEQNFSSNETWKRNDGLNTHSSKQGKLGLLALAMECLADRDISLASS